VVIHNLDVARIAVSPAKTDPPLLVYTYAPLAFAIAPKRFEVIARRVPQVGHGQCSIQLAQLAKRSLLNVTGQLSARSTLP
jgi:hypothetical protein